MLPAAHLLRLQWHCTCCSSPEAPVALEQCVVTGHLATVAVCSLERNHSEYEYVPHMTQELPDAL